MLTAVITTSDLPNLAREINDAHRQVRMHGRGILMEAKRAGEALLVAKQQCRHGDFLPWLKANCEVSERHARRYMDVAQRWPDRTRVADFDPSEVSIREFLGLTDKPRRSAVLPPFTRADADYAMKLHRMAEGPANENEAAVAKAKLEQHAANHGMTTEQVVEKSRKELGLDWIEQKQQFGTVESAMVRVIEKKLGAKPQADLLQLIIMMVMDHPENLSTLKDHLR